MTASLFTQVQESLLDFAKTSSLVKGLILLGSRAIGEETGTSDLDILFIVSEGQAKSEFQRKLVEVFHREYNGKNRNRSGNFGAMEEEDDLPKEKMSKVSIKTQLLMPEKTVIYLSDERCETYKIDVGHTTDVLHCARFIVGSEIKLQHLHGIILLDYVEEDGPASRCLGNKENGKIFQQIKSLLSSQDPYISSGLTDADPKFLITEFVERFDSCVSCVLKSDSYRIKFYMFILRHRVICLEMLLGLGCREHVYLPKQAYRNEGISKICIDTDTPLDELRTLLAVFSKLDVSSIDMDDTFNGEIFQDHIDFLHGRLATVNSLKSRFE